MTDAFQRPRPRGLFLGIDESMVKGLEPLFPTAREIQSYSEVNLSDWDVIVTSEPIGEGRSPWIDANIHILSVAPSGWMGPVSGGANPVLRTDSSSRGGAVSRAAQLAISASAPDPFGPLLADLARAAGSIGPHSCLLAGADLVRLAGGVVGDPSGAELLNALVSTSDQYPIAAWWRRGEGEAGTTISLPALEIDLAAWVVAAIVFWRAMDLARFPLPTGAWSLDADWMMASEVAARAVGDELRAEKSRLVADVDARIASAEASLGERRAEVDAHERLLLTGTGDPLASQVGSVLRDLGFHVRDMDLEWPPNDRREDLRVTDDADPDWISLTEVKGYGRGGAKSGDLISLSGRFSRRFSLEEHREPSALWYVINQRYETPPPDRPREPSVAHGDLQAFAAEGGLIVDTQDLFRLARDFKDGRVSATDARDELKSAVGWFRWPTQE